MYQERACCAGGIAGPCVKPTSSPIFIAASAALFVAGCTSSSTAPGGESGTASTSAAGVSVETAPVTLRLVPRYLSITGQLKSAREADLAASADGRVTAVFVERGSSVKAGEVLAQLDVRSAALSAVEARAQADGAVIASENARTECERARSLLASGALSRAEFDRANGQCRTSVSAVAAAEARARLAAQNVGDGAIRAPFAGVVAERYLDVGEYVRRDSRVVTLVDLSAMRLELTIPEANIAYAQPGAKVVFSVAGYPDRTFTASLAFVGASVRSTTRDLVADATVDINDAALRPGMFASGRLVAGEEKFPVVPKTAVVTRDGKPTAFVSVGGRIEQRLVQIGEPSGGDLVVTRGVADGENVVIAPSSELRNGDRVGAK